jgi:nucleotidyltransferase substrate binding protein (TIGR01987 family)
MNDQLDLSPLQNAVSRLAEGMARYEADTSDEQIRDGLIHRFKLAYELSHKMLKRFFERTAANPAQYDEMSFQDLIRSGNEQGLLRSGWDIWRNYRQARTDTRHTYNQSMALQVVAQLPDFLLEVRHLLDQLQARTRRVIDR